MKDGEPFNPYKLFNGAYIPFSLLESFELSSTAKLLYARLTAYAGEDGFAYPKQKTLAADLGLKTQSNVSHALRQLIDAKFIRVMKPTGKEKLNNKGDKYEFLWNEVLVKSLKNDESTTSKYRSPSIDKSISEDMVYRSCENRNIDTVYKDEKNHIEKNHKESTKTKKPEPLPVEPEKIVDLYHHILPELATVKLIHKKRIDQLKIIFKNWPNSQNLDWWGKYFTQARSYPYVLNGIKGENGRNDWEASFDYFIKLEKLMWFVERSGA